MQLRFSLLSMLLSFSTALSLSTHAKETDLAVDFRPAFEGHEFTQPIFLTAPGDGSGQVAVMGQLGTVEILDGPEDSSPEMLLDIRDRVLFDKNENEQGLLGMAFHPLYADNGEIFVYYSIDHNKFGGPRRSVVSRFTSKQGKVDPESEEILMTIEQPYWNHNGGTIVFGPDGMLYIAIGDGGKYDDPHGNGQDPMTFLGSVLRIDVEKKSTLDGEKLAYGIPADNPFAGKPELGRGEVWAYGLRNVWRMAFDRETGELWAGDVGQNIWEEIDILEGGKNYGWNTREGKHAFKSKNGIKSSEPFQGEELVEPVWEYNHSEGKSITGGHVYRGKALTQLTGMYLYADYITGRIYALDYDRESKKVRKNHILREKGLPITSFGQDAKGESYFMQTDGLIYQLVTP